MVLVDKAHFASTKNNPSWFDFAFLMSLKHGDSRLLNQEIKK